MASRWAFDRVPLGLRLRAAAACVVLPPLIRGMSLARLVRLVDWTRWERGTTAEARSERHLVEWVDGFLDRLPGLWRRSCLNRSVVLYALLPPGPAGPELVVGVRRQNDGALDAHAWLMRDGSPIYEREGVPDSFVRISTFGTGRSQ